jgi:hypothetical protein
MEHTIPESLNPEFYAKKEMKIHHINALGT